ncbi:hypothetical protein [Neorhizobium sp. JUb45]|uniref:hypothetical protein n=1 Tax=unclassified Neorhizobium TaxID=2629175 RepID=UPI001042D199|nr:hypothetical protein [Neorhizobium sp. JUb45]TCR04050.1 hypothetical protein EDF70_102146 [Neorhizobium sp. JUb45]
MTDNAFRQILAKTHQDGKPQLTMPGANLGDGTDAIESTTYNHEPYNNNLLSWGTKLLHAAYIVVDDILPAGEFKRYSKFVRIHRSEYHGILIRFTGMKTSLYSIEDLAPSPKVARDGNLLKDGSLTKERGAGMASMKAGESDVGSAGRDAIDLVNKSSGGIPIQIDSVYQIDLLPLHSNRSCLVTDNKVLEFNFNNGARAERAFPGEFGRNLYVAFDVINKAPLPQIIRFDVQVLMMVGGSSHGEPIKPSVEKAGGIGYPAWRRPEDTAAGGGAPTNLIPSDASGDTRVPVGRVSSARPNGLSGTIPIGMETNALDVISENTAHTK